ncbi:F-box only protein 41-like isoform X2 [Pomacea canaliculata]|uniref:F-box only protein 41-like isoform X2 n=1 Tax=Pomacea canaliculata TaxID=400727 RepID=UPI000D727D59|nr:F-box only protein 41-like isoform X2 [Pomacea canaliculata]
MLSCMVYRAGQRQAGETLDEYNRRTKACLEPGLEELLKVSQDSLTTVSIVACSNILTDKCLWLVSGYCRLLERLTYISDTHPLTAEVMWALGGGCPSITSLMVPPLHTGTLKQGLTNRCLLLMAQFYPDLLQLGIGGHALDATGLVPLVQSCQRLQFLSLNHIKELKDDTVAAMCKAGLRQLQRLELNCIPLKAEAIRNFYNSCRHLKELRVTVSIHDYWEDARKKKNREDYKKILASLEELKSQAGLGNILRLQAASVD